MEARPNTTTDIEDAAIASSSNAAANGKESSDSGGGNDELRSKLRSLEEKVASSRARRWEVRERMRDLRVQLQGNAQAQHASHAAFDQLKVQAKVRCE
jgi:hypothetical protein